MKAQKNWRLVSAELIFTTVLWTAQARVAYAQAVAQKNWAVLARASLHAHVIWPQVESLRTRGRGSYRTREGSPALTRVACSLVRFPLERLVFR
jgi:hypothetical protein